ncbi:hypothetical protein EOL94_02920 [bacterium]|nr:hypothetical protein [bacterium]
MSYYKKKKNDNFLKKIFCSQLFWMIILFSLLIAIIIPMYNVWQKQEEINEEIEKFKLEKEKYEIENKEWTEMINYLQSEDSLEDRARTNLNLKKEGETVVVIKRGDEVDLFKNSGDDKNIENLSNPEKWLRYFIK